jgi:hypothetical protein
VRYVDLVAPGVVGTGGGHLSKPGGRGCHDAAHHLNGNHVAAVHGDEAEHTCYYQAQHVRLGLPDGEKFLGGGRYDDRLRRTPDGWRFTHRRITSVWSEGNPAVITS